MADFEFTSSLTFYLILLNTGASLAALYLYPSMLKAGYLKPYRVVREHTWYELLTSGFLHVNLGHLFVNMFTLYFFGTVMEQTLGPDYFGGLYLSGLVISGIPSLVKYRNNPDYATLGASGAIGAVLFAFIFLYPMEDLVMLFLPIPIPAFVFAILYLFYSMYESKKARGKVNHEAHLSGALWGIIYLIIVVPRAMERFLSVTGLG